MLCPHILFLAGRTLLSDLNSTSQRLLAVFGSRFCYLKTLEKVLSSVKGRPRVTVILFYKVCASAV